MTRSIPTTASRATGLARRQRPRTRSGADATRPATARSSSSWRDPLLFGAAATVIASLGSWIPSKWNDEAATQTAATRSLAQLWQMMHNIDAVHGTYYAFMHFWIIAFGTSNFAMRVPSMLAVGVATAGVVVLGKRLGSRRIAICSAAVFMILPRVTWMGMEARSYASTAAIAVWLTIILLRAIDRRQPLWWGLYVVVAALGVLDNVYVALLVVAHGVAILISRRRLDRPRRLLTGWGISAVLAAALSSPIAFLTMGQTRQLPFGPLRLSSVSNTLLIEQYFTGATPTVGRGVAVPPTSLWATAAIVVAVIGWLLIAAPVVFRRIRPTPRESSPLTLVAVAVPWIVVPVVLVIGFSLVVTPIYTARYYSFTTPAVALLIGTSIAALGRRWQRVVAVAVLAVLVLPIYVSQRGPTSKNGTDWEQAAQIIQQRAKPGQDIYYGPVRPGSTVPMSKVADAYPAVLSTLHNITLKQTGVQSAMLWDSQWPLSHAVSTLRTTPLLWAVTQHYGTPSPASTTQERYIEAQGLHLVHIWRGSSTDVMLFTR
jgi:mannosyltransferase